MDRHPITKLVHELIDLSGLSEDEATRFVQRTYIMGGEDQRQRDLTEIRALQHDNALLREGINRLSATAST